MSQKGNKKSRERRVRIIGVPTDYGGNRRGVDMGPSAVRYAGLEEEISKTGAESIDVGDIPVPTEDDLKAKNFPSVDLEGKAKSVAETEYVSRHLADEVESAVSDGDIPLVVGGDHSISIGSMNGASRNEEIGVIWFDAHGDFNTPQTSPSGNVHGMPMGAALGRDSFEGVEWAHSPNISEENVVLVGIRSLDDAERENLLDSQATVYTMHEIDEVGISEVVREAIDKATAGVDEIHVSFDLDLLDPNEAPGVGTPVPGGVSYREAHLALEILAERDDHEEFVRSMDLVEVNPILDEHNKTAELATELAASAFGKRII